MEFDDLATQLYKRLQQYYNSESSQEKEIAKEQLIKACAKIVPNGMVRELSEKEKVILTLVSEGESNKGIAEKLELSERTIKNYLSIIYTLLQVNNRTQAVIVAAQKGLIDFT